MPVSRAVSIHSNICHRDTYPSPTKLITPLLVTSTRPSKDSGAMLAGELTRVQSGTALLRGDIDVRVSVRIYVRRKYMRRSAQVFCCCFVYVLRDVCFTSAQVRITLKEPSREVGALIVLAASNCGRVCTRAALLAASQRSKIHFQNRRSPCDTVCTYDTFSVR